MQLTFVYDSWQCSFLDIVDMATQHGGKLCLSPTSRSLLVQNIQCQNPTVYFRLDLVTTLKSPEHYKATCNFLRLAAFVALRQKEVVKEMCFGFPMWTICCWMLLVKQSLLRLCNRNCYQDGLITAEPI